MGRQGKEGDGRGGNGKARDGREWEGIGRQGKGWEGMGVEWRCVKDWEGRKKRLPLNNLHSTGDSVSSGK